jgi:hypothetical protein
MRRASRTPSRPTVPRSAAARGGRLTGVPMQACGSRRPPRDRPPDVSFERTRPSAAGPYSPPSRMSPGESALVKRAADGRDYPAAVRSGRSRDTLGLVASQARLFDPRCRTDSSPARYSESAFGFLNRVDDPAFEAVRVLLQNWFDAYPADHQAELRSRFRARSQRQVASAYWELYLHELHRRLGFEITIHPEVTGTTRRPDFRVEQPGMAFYLEGTVIADSDEELERRRREAVVMDMINETRNDHFSLSMEWKRDATTMPRTKEVTGKIEAWLACLDRKRERERHKDSGWDDSRPSPASAQVIEFGGWAVSLTAYPRTYPGPDQDRRIIGSGPTRGGFVDCVTPILGTLKHKASRYGKPDLPYVIAPGLMLDFGDLDDLEQALYGPETHRVTWSYDTGVVGAIPGRDPRGLWQWGREQRGTRVSAVLGVQAPYPYSVVSAEPSIWHNPWSARPLEYEYPFTTIRGNLSENRLERIPASRVAHRIFGLPAHWPGVEPFQARHARMAARVRDHTTQQ